MLSGKGYSCICQSPDSPLEAQCPEPRNDTQAFNIALSMEDWSAETQHTFSTSNYGRRATLLLYLLPLLHRNPEAVPLVVFYFVTPVWDRKRRVEASSLDE
ncbi:predicted protein [Histoplasma capsulatum G186AR]|uniref:Uncharacterized protein n=1 Tax=Ajellomyces capsulatus (strain G186AR / H82 / ATCC MYA-2454 / RMSCC 2432) TaxID=447093 RepID=C0NBG5_AJECG|nr:uncharacterized protein HCBG_00461 [Histoplasma capsulatum G186AR]EEH11006.1 predicted protein [Histoplasma capsulatum G186AR]